MIPHGAFAMWCAASAFLGQTADRGYLGLTTVQTPEGAVVVQVEPNGPAAKADLRVGDVVVSADGRKVDAQAPLHATVAAKKPGAKMALQVRRGEQTLATTATFGLRPVGDRQAATRFKPVRDDDDEPAEGWQLGQPNMSRQFNQVGFEQAPGLLPAGRPMLGVTVQDPDNVMRDKFKLGDTLGVLVTEVRAKSPAQEAGLEVGDMIQWIDGKPAKDAATVQVTIASLPENKVIAVKYWRKDAVKEAKVTVRPLAPPTAVPTPLVGGTEVAELRRQVSELTKRVEDLERTLKIGGGALKNVPSTPDGKSKGGRVSDLPSPADFK